MAFTLNLIGPSPWGFRICGGRDFKKALTVSKVNGGSKAEQADLQTGDVILEINGENTADMLNVEAQNKIKNSKTHLQMLVERPEPSSPRQTNGISTPEQLTGRFQEAVIVSRDENQNYRDYNIYSPASVSPGPYSPIPPASPDGKKEQLTANINKSVQLRSWSPEEKTHRLSRPLSQEFSPSDYRNNSVSSRTPTPPGSYSPQSPVDRDVPMSPRRSRFGPRSGTPSLLCRPLLPPPPPQPITDCATTMHPPLRVAWPMISPPRAHLSASPVFLSGLVEIEVCALHLCVLIVFYQQCCSSQK